MLNHFSKIAKLNTVLIISIIILSFYTVSWHHQNYLLYRKSNAVQTENQRVMALHKQLLTEHSEQISGQEIQDNALKKIQMTIPKLKEDIIL
ncbi:MAG: cell division protein FtsL [Candidatus Thioglobus sp.]|nr:cell division protein FtsL [Candidatus Thioglobus sp.]